MMPAIEQQTLPYRRITVIATTLTYVILAASGLIGSAIAWDDLRKSVAK